MDRDLVEKLLTAQVLTLAVALTAEWHRNHNGSCGDHLSDAIRLVKQKQAEVISALLAAPDTADS